MSPIKPSQLLIKIIPVSIILTLTIALIMVIPVGYNIQHNDWIGFYGAIVGSFLGGYITYLGVQISIDHNQKLRIGQENESKERKRKEILPHITAELKDARLIEGSDTRGGCDYEIGLKFRNIGKDNCVNLLITLNYENLENSIGSSAIQFFQKNSLVKNEFSNEVSIIVNPITRNLVSIDIVFCDLELRFYSQTIKTKLVYPSSSDIERGDSDYILTQVESSIPKLSL